ncbi:3-deoxy-D-manno-octulosonic acid kinase [Vibrio ostreicida]|uniref:3-deoxy-D-manno-octulosonic acid kinase n=1 Tax=Vibrio ostreicida TaxID=526588 RepID=A0ABT8BMY7_9VIBR|nr:3-deoxy-D-manno-octulosonic acid kinase [Vibrio ostreicida]MDN3608507.1 3-deoxy-D-manno-octulosonic acid kinase [Vibrio ostreicida]NPD10329.1 3-deoxy-D-manno-octulosonic acid kinase [Vibrio ostreicida]
MKTVSFANQTIWYDENLLSEEPQHVFEPEFWHQKGRVLGEAQGRGTTWFVQTETVDAALRHYFRGGLFGKLVADSYWFSGWNRTRSFQELMLLNTLTKAGVNVPRPIAARAVRTGFTYTADILSEKVPHGRDLVSRLVESALSHEVYRNIGREIRKMHDAQVNHTDLNIHNILLNSHSEVWIIDFDKCFQQDGEHWKSGNLDRLRRSFEKERMKRAIHWESDDFNALKIGYAESDKKQNEL